MFATGVCQIARHGEEMTQFLNRYESKKTHSFKNTAFFCPSLLDCGPMSLCFEKVIDVRLDFLKVLLTFAIYSS